MQVEGGRTEDGYAFELRVPFEDLPQTSRSRFKFPIGFDVQVSDYDPEFQTHYVWGGKSGNWSRADQFQRAVPILSAMAKRSTLIRLMTTFTKPDSTFIAAAVFPAGTFLDANHLKVTYDFKGFSIDDPKAGGINPGPISSQPEAIEIHEERTDSLLNLGIIEKKLRFTKLAGGRYTFRTGLEGLGECISDTTRGFYTEDGTRSRMDMLDTYPDVRTLTKIIQENIRLHTPFHHVFGFSDIDIDVNLNQTPEVKWGLSEQIGKNREIFYLRLDITSQSGQTIYSHSLPLGLGNLKISISPAELPVGVYTAKPSLQTPDGSYEVWDPDYDSTAAIFLAIHGNRDYVIRTTLEQADPLFTRGTVIGNPNRKRYPKDNKANTYARSVWDLQHFEGRIFIGSGDANRNQGPIDMWSFRPSEKRPTEYTFENEFTVNEEAVDILRVYDKKLLIPGFDTMGSIDFGSLYVKESGQWRTARTIPNSHHTFDVISHDGKLYVTAQTDEKAVLYESEDGGESWVGYSMDGIDGFRDWRYWEMGICNNALIIMSNYAEDRFYEFKSGKLKRVVAPLFPGINTGRTLAHRVTSFAGGVLYTLRDSFREPRHPKPLFFLNDLPRGGEMIELFAEKSAQDILKRDNVCYVLVSQREDPEFHNEIYRSSDLKIWKKIADFTTQARAFSLEEMNSIFYVGLASIGKEVNVASGDICKLEP